MCLVDLEVVGRPGVTRTRNARLLEPAPKRRVDDSGSGEALDLLEGIDRVEQLEVERGGVRRGIVQLPQTPSELRDRDAACA